MSTYSPKQWMLGLGLISALFSVVCMGWGLLLSDPVLQEFHWQLVRITYIGVSAMNLQGFMIAVLEGAVYGGIIGWILASCLNLFAGK